MSDAERLKEFMVALEALMNEHGVLFDDGGNREYPISFIKGEYWANANIPDGYNGHIPYKEVKW